MPTIASQSGIARELERVLDNNEEYIGSKVFEELADAHKEIDIQAQDLELEIQSLKEELEELKNGN